MGRMEASWIGLTPEQRAELSGAFGSSGWRRITRDELPSVFPAALRAKIDSALLITEDTTTGGTYLILSAWRLDRKDRAFDLEPFGLIIHANGASDEGVFIHHGEWDQRTRPIPNELLDLIDSEGVGDYLWATPPEDESEGHLISLSPLPHRGAFREAVREIRARVDGRKNSA
jgi:hypothetical protein